MNTFHPFGPLSPDDGRFRGRAAELAALARLCQGEVEAYAIVYGGRQTGKTSLLLRLPRYLPATVTTCRVDFQACSGLDTPAACRYLAEQIASALPQSLVAREVHGSPDLIRFIAEAAGQSGVHRLVLLLEELGPLPLATRCDLANIVRAIFNARFDPTKRGLARVLVILAGGIELYDLAVTQVSPLHNICEAIHLPDLAEAEAIALAQDGLSALELEPHEAKSLAEAIYALLLGHPYLTQRLGSILELAITRGEQLTIGHVQTAGRQILDDDVLMRHLRHGVKDYRLQDACRQLLTGQVRDSRDDEPMAQLELLGLARQHDGYWIVCNSLIEQALRSWLGLSAEQSKTGKGTGGVAPAQRQLRQKEAEELQRRFESLTKQITALDIDIGRENDEFRKQPLQDRRAGRTAERASIVEQLAEIERQLADSDLASGA